MKEETWNKIEEEFEKEFPSMFWVGEDPDNVKDFLRQKLEEQKKEILEEIKQFVISESGKSGRKEIIEFIEAKLKELN